MKKPENSKTLIKELAAAYEPPQENSVRTTFKLSKKAMDDLEAIAIAEEATTKSAFDSICNMLIGDSADNEKVTATLVSLAKAAPTFEGTRKTYVTSIRANRLINGLADKHGLERDRLVDCLIKTYREVVEYHREKNDMHLISLQKKMQEIREIWETVDADEIAALSEAFPDAADIFANEMEENLLWITDSLTNLEL